MFIADSWSIYYHMKDKNNIDSIIYYKNNNNYASVIKLINHSHM